MSKVYEKLNQTAESNIEPLAKQSFKIKDTSKIINILRDSLYKHKERTLVQEYISNARDAVRERYKIQLVKKDPNLDPQKHSGNDRALAERKLRTKINELIKPTDIKVTIPSQLNPFFKVRDYGVGLSPERVANVFTYYCESTKGDSDIETGGFGIGGKSAWAYTDHFTVISFHDGKRYTYTSHTEKQEGELALDDVSDTTEANGVEIIVGVNPKDLNIFKNAVLRVCYFWKTRPVITGLTQADMPEWYDTTPDLAVGSWQVFMNKWAEEVNDYRVFQDETVSFIFVLDGIPYAEALPVSLTNELQSIIGHQNRKGKRMVVVFDAELGSVDIVASREHLAKTPKTLNVLQKLTIKNELKNYYQKLDTEVTTVKDRSALFYKFYHLLGYEFMTDLTGTVKNRKTYEVGNFTYSPSATYAQPAFDVSVKNGFKTQYKIFPITIKYDINDKIVVSVGDFKTEGSFKTDAEKDLPVLIQDEELSVMNRRIKVIEFHKETDLRNFILIEPTDLTTTDLAHQAKHSLEGRLTSEFELVQTERQEIKRVTGVYTLYKITMNYRHTKDKFQKEPSFFDTLKVPLLLATEEEFKAMINTRESKELLRQIQILGAELYLAAPSTIAKIKGKKNVFMYTDFIKKIDKHLSLPPEAISYLYRNYFLKFSEILEKEFHCFTSPASRHLISELKDSGLKGALTKGLEFLEEVKHHKGYGYQLNIPFMETYFPSVTKKIKSLNYNNYYNDLMEKKRIYPLIPRNNDTLLAKEIVIYVNAKYQNSKK